MVIYKFIKNLILNIKYTRILKRIYKEENLLNNFSKLFGTEFRLDWVGRMYTIINPNIIDEKLDVNTQIFEYGPNGLTNAPYIEKWIMTKFNLAENFIMANNLFELLTYEIVKLDEYDNYLFIVKPITFDDCMKWTKIFVGVYSTLIITAITLLFVIK